MSKKEERVHLAGTAKMVARYVAMRNGVLDELITWQHAFIQQNCLIKLFNRLIRKKRIQND